jgi:2-oxoglutarate dehydrogenase E2 component (dihydrolipoamide succinyltransferase)
MLIEVKVPVLAESITEATLATWNKKPGDVVHRNENLVDMETDKVMLEIVAPKDGVLTEIKKMEGDNVSSNDVIAVIDTAIPEGIVVQKEQSVKNVPADIRAGLGDTSLRDSSHAELSPAVRKLIADNNLDLSQIKGSGKNGRIVKSDVLDHMEHIQMASQEESQPLASVSTPSPAAAPENKIARAPVVIDDERTEKRVPMSRLRQRVAERLKDAQNTAAILTTFNEVNMKPVMDLRARYKERFQERHNVKLGMMSFFTKAVVEALKQFPIINATVDGNDIIYHGYYDIGIAVGTPRGLVVPILRNVDSMSFADVELAIQDYGQRAREGKLTLDELTGGTFSISNGGVYGSMLSTPILNPPQSAILGMHNIVERPVVENGEIVVRPMMYVALSYDHRIIDGHDAVLFLVAVKQIIEDPTRMLLDI